MSEPNLSGDWFGTWMSAQRDLWESLLGVRPPGVPSSGPDTASGAWAPGLPESPRQLAARMLEVGESYLGVTRQVWKALEAVQGASAAQADLAKQLDALKSQFLAGFAQAFPAGAGALPALGPTRERQQAAERLQRAVLRYQQALARFSDMLAKVSSEAVERLAERLKEGVGAGRPPDSLRAVYDLWVECGEQAYAAAAHAPEFAQVQAELSDALLDLRREQQKQVEDWARALDLPTRAEINTLIKRVNSLRRRLRELEEEVEQLGRRG